MIEILKTKNEEIYKAFGFDSSCIVMAASDSGEVLGAGAVMIKDGYATLEGIAMKEEYKAFNMEYAIGKSLLNMLDLSGIRFVATNTKDERLAISLRFKKEKPEDAPIPDFDYYLCLDGYFTEHSC